MKLIPILLLGGVAVTLHAAPVPVISQNRDGRLEYDADAHGNRVPDFSSCGYAAQARAIPCAPVRIVVEARPGDRTACIQQALDHVASLPVDANGLRGAVLLLKGRHEVFGGLTITKSGIVLRGQGMGENGTALVAAGQDRRTLLCIKGGKDRPGDATPDWHVADDYVPVGATNVRLRSARALQVGNTIKLTRPCTAAWIEKLGALEFGGGVGGGWRPGSRDLVWNRIVTRIEGDMVTLDAPITTALEQQFGGGSVTTFSGEDATTEVGVENLRLESAFEARQPQDENHAWCAITMEHTRNAWVRQVTFKHFAGSAIALYETCQCITVQDCVSLEPVSEIGGYRRHTFFTMGQRTLFLRCYAEHGRHDFSVGHCAAGPNAFVQCEAREALADSGPIESWASGVLFDNVRIDGNALTFGYRPGNHAGIGWAAANCVLWNCSAAVIRCWNPPGAQNWSFGSWAGFEGDGIWRGSNDFMKPESLFAAQLQDRLGKAAAARLHLMPTPREESSNPPLAKAQELAAAAHTPAPQLRDYILDAPQRDPIPDEPGSVKHVEEVSQPLSSSSHPRSPLVLTNGWITVNGRLLIGGITNGLWWRGNIRPAEAANFGPNVTRFVPGRMGPGFTDDLREVAETLVAGGLAAFDHNYGLWYDRRRDDHERIRRMDGNVLPPFYEQPFARSGQGTAWDGLSQYDLSKFNPWYWSRLREFADVADRHGLVLFHENYFQHNILEAGAHWADFPWRAANNINHTDFPEPPPYAGDKRIFQAELFYDVTHPVRRRLHEGYILQCLANFATNANVIQFTGAEFTGPLHFMRFWLDTVAAWEGAAGRMPAATKPIIALCATKDVQDAILADAQRSAIVDVIAFRYWWATDQGLYAPPGGKNLAPRQFSRPLQPRAPSDENLATMAAEYRAKFPDKPVIAASEQGNDLSRCGWAYVCAGGSMPRLPQSTDARLLAAIPRMQPWASASQGGRWVLREKGRQLLVFGGAGELDLSDDSGVFRVNAVNPHTGEVTLGGTLEVGGKVKLPDATVLWMTRE